MPAREQDARSAAAGGAEARSGRTHALFVVLLATVAYGWVLALPFRWDDYGLIPKAPEQLDTLVDRIGQSVSGVEPERAREEYLCRPLLWALFSAELALSGDRPQAMVFHAGSLLLHVLVSLTVLALCRRFLPPGPALLGACFFAIHPTGAQAVSWISAGGDQGVALGGAVAVLVLTRRSGRPGLTGLLGGAAMAVALLSKMTALGLLPIVAVAACGAREPARWRKTGWRLGGLAVPIAISLLVRRAHLGGVSPQYVGRSFAVDDVPRMIENLPAFLVHTLRPWVLLEDVHDLWPALHALGELVPVGLIVLPLLAASLGSAREFLPRLLGGGLAFAVFAVPALWAYAGPTTYATTSRNFYALMVPLAFIMGAAAAALPRATSGPGRALRWAILGFPLLVSLDALVHGARVELRAGDLLRARVQVVEDVLDRRGTGITVVVIDSRPTVGGVMLTGELVGLVHRPPFRDRPARVLHFHSPAELWASGLLQKEPRATQLLEFIGESGRQLGGLLPAIPTRASGWRVHSAVPSREGARWALSSAVPTRSIAALRIRLPHAMDAEGTLLLHTTQGTLERPWSTSGTAEAVVVLADGLGWLVRGALSVVWVSLAEPMVVDPGAWPTPEILTEMPSVEVEAPAHGTRLELGTVPEIVISEWPSGCRVKLIFECVLRQARIPMIFDAASTDLGTDGAQLKFDASPIRAGSPGLADLTWRTLPSYFERHLKPEGYESLTIEWVAEAWSPDGRLLARSSRHVFELR
ncbi:MAG: hypothetical protein CMJ83_04925 [Planctomycetes bacterium]|nr:hypothetical protein [Planctomycetota bacterium]